MKKSYIAKLALKNIIAHKLRSVLTILGIAIGVGFIIFLLSLGYGLQQISTKQIANIDALQIIDVTPGKSKIVEINDETLARFQKLSNVTKTEPQVNVIANIMQGTSKTEGVVYGKSQEYLALEEPELEKGVIYTSNLEKSALINKSALKQLGISADSIIGEKIKLNIIIPADLLTGAEKPLSKEEDFKVVGILKNESSPYVYIPLDTFKEYGVKQYSAVKVQVSDKKYTDITKAQLENLGFKTVALKNTVDQINQFFVVFQLILLSFGIIAIIIASIGMFNTLTISLLEKTREISFMKVMGTTSKDIWQMFLGESIIIGTIGTSMGIAGGLLLGDGLNNFLVALAQRTGNRPVEIFYAPFIFIALTFLIALLISILTGIYPSSRASKVDPMEVLRYE